MPTSTVLRTRKSGSTGSPMSIRRTAPNASHHLSSLPPSATKKSLRASARASSMYRSKAPGSACSTTRACLWISAASLNLTNILEHHLSDAPLEGRRGAERAPEVGAGGAGLHEHEHLPDAVEVP